jgi:hypothetical protein
MALAGFVFYSCNNSSTKKVSHPDSLSHSEDTTLLSKYEPGELRTNWNNHSVPIDSIHDGGPGKNGIPAIDFPEFVSVDGARRFLTDPDFGILIINGNEEKFYPLKILNWHEVVNDNIAALSVAVTFCPLCGSAIVYNRTVDGDTLLFGVSGKLYESNMLMFDEGTESLWSQASGVAIAGDLTSKNLELINSSIFSF